jgi:hypothetical protein
MSLVHWAQRLLCLVLIKLGARAARFSLACIPRPFMLRRAWRISLQPRPTNILLYYEPSLVQVYKRGRLGVDGAGVSLCWYSGVLEPSDAAHETFSEFSCHQNFKVYILETVLVATTSCSSSSVLS